MSASHVASTFRAYAHLKELLTANQASSIRTKGKAKALTRSAVQENQNQTEQYNCNDGYSNWKMSWSVEKQKWCCSHQRKACWQTMTETPEVDSELEEAAKRNAV